MLYPEYKIVNGEETITMVTEHQGDGPHPGELVMYTLRGHPTDQEIIDLHVHDSRAAGEDITAAEVCVTDRKINPNFRVNLVVRRTTVSEWTPAPSSRPKIVMTDKDVGQLVEDALDAACALIQGRLYPPDMADGGAAGMFFSGAEDEEVVRSRLKEYVLFEINGLNQMP